MAELADSIRKIPLFSSLSREDVAKVLGKFEEIAHPAGATIFHQGDTGDAFYLIRSGTVEVVLEGAGGRSETLAVLGAQEGFGEMALLSGEPRSATIVAVKDTTLWRLSREAWTDLIEKHPTWLLHFCALLSKRLSRVEHAYSTGRDAFNSLAEEFYDARPPEEQRFFRHAALLDAIDPETMEFLLDMEGSKSFLAHVEASHAPLIRAADGRRELHGFFRCLLISKLVAQAAEEAEGEIHSRIAARFEALQDWPAALRHRIAAEDWASAVDAIEAHREDLLNDSAGLVKQALDKMPPDVFYRDPRLVHIKAETLARLGDFTAAVRTYKEVISQRSGAAPSAAVVRYQ